MRSFLVIVILMVVGCKQNTNVTEPVYTIVPDMNHWLKDSLGNWTISPQFGYYGDKNFILDENGRLFYYGYAVDYTWDCMPQSNPPIPLQEIIYLKPTDVIELNESLIENFVDLNINKFKNPYSRYTTIAIGTARDTFTAPILTKVIAAFNRDKILYMIRPMTEEEKIILAHLKEGKPFYFSEVVWGSTKVNINKLK